MNKPEGPFCQSCSMPLTKSEDFGTEADGSESKDYCKFCYQEGKFTSPDMSMDDMVSYLASNWGEWTQRPDLTAEQAKPEITSILSNLKRWQT
jgi:hypothetical protein